MFVFSFVWLTTNHLKRNINRTSCNRCIPFKHILSILFIKFLFFKLTVKRIYKYWVYTNDTRPFTYAQVCMCVRACVLLWVNKSRDLMKSPRGSWNFWNNIFSERFREYPISLGSQSYCNIHTSHGHTICCPNMCPNTCIRCHLFSWWASAEHCL